MPAIYIHRRAPGEVLCGRLEQIEAVLESYRTMSARVSRTAKRLRGMGMMIGYNGVYKIMKENRWGHVIDCKIAQAQMDAL